MLMFFKGHGKRNGGNGLLRRRDDVPVGDTRWYLSRLIQPPAEPDLKPWRTSDPYRKHGPNRRLQNDSDVDAENAKRFAMLHCSLYTVIAHLFYFIYFYVLFNVT